jgi:peptidoglycan/xylan/chitin deacetylase (PgdA/CDA1 family)
LEQRLRKRILIFIAACFYYSGLVKLARWWTQLRGRSVVVLIYHTATGDNLRDHLLYLRRHYRLLHLEAALEDLYTSHSRKPRQRDRRTALTLTFDDGYYDNYTHGFALAQELQIPMTIFLIPGYIESGKHFWWEEGKHLVSYAQVDKVTIEGHTYQLDQPQERKLLTQVIDSHLRHATSVAEREAFLVSARQALAIQEAVIPEEEAVLPMGWSQIREMEESGWLSFGAHTMNHPILSYLTDGVEVEHEVKACREVLEQKLGHPVRTFAYPVGQFQHIGDDIRLAVQQAGYEWALTSVYGYNTASSNPYLLRRIEVDVSQHWLVVAAEAAGLWGFFSRLRWHPFIRKNFTNAS